MPITLVDNIPVMFSVFTMNPEIYAGVGGSLRSIGLVIGVGLMDSPEANTPSLITSNGAR